jgi:hypothetical protein
MGKSAARAETGALPVTRALLYTALLLTLILVTVQLLIQTQPNHTEELQTFFIPPAGCPMPCFMGIRPGFTTASEGGVILEAHPWVRDFEVTFDTNAREGQFVWTWSGSQPAQIRDEEPGILRICDSLICSLSIGTRIPYGAFVLAFGQPDSGTLRSLPDNQYNTVVHTALYDPFQLDIRTYGSCPPLFTMMGLHHQHITFHIGIVRDQISRSRFQTARIQVINFQKQTVSWLQRRGFVCPS